jgi:hypothetical protein
LTLTPLAILADASLSRIDHSMPRGPPLKERLGKATLEKLYNQPGLCTVQIASRHGSTSPAILKLMDDYGLPRRSKGAVKT